MQQAALQAESLAYTVLARVISRFQMENLFNDEVPMLKLMFYQLDRLISIQLSDLHDHFKDENISASLFSSSFFITVFTSHMQAQSTNEDSWKIQRVWDHFLVQGWKTLFKVCLLILSTYEVELLQMSFEQLVATLIQLPYRFLVQDCERLRKDCLKAGAEDDAAEPKSTGFPEKNEQDADARNRDGSIVEFTVA